MSITSILTTPIQDADLTLEFTRFEPHPVHEVPAYFFRMVHRDSKEELGRINLRVASSPHIELYAGHIGYGVHPAHRGHRYAARATRLLIPLAHELHINPLWLTCNPENLSSRRSCELAGAQFIEIVNVPDTCIINRDGHPRKCRYRLLVAGTD